MASFSSEINLSQSAEFFSRFGRFGGDKEKLQKLLGDDKLMKWWLERLGEFPGFQLIHGFFTAIEAQLARIRELNSEHGWGFTEEDFATAEASVPNWPDGKLVAVTLVPYLPDGDGMGGVERTFQELWKAAATAQHANWRWDGYDKADPDRLRLLKGIEHPAKDKPVLRWEVIDLGCTAIASQSTFATLRPHRTQASSPPLRSTPSGSKPWMATRFLMFGRLAMRSTSPMGIHGGTCRVWTSVGAIARSG